MARVVIPCSTPSKWLKEMIPWHKKIEIRPATPKWIGVKGGDVLEVSCGDRTENFLVICASGHASYKAALEAVHVVYVWPGVTTDDEGVKICEELYGPLPPGTNVIAMTIEHIDDKGQSFSGYAFPGTVELLSKAK